MRKRISSGPEKSGGSKTGASRPIALTRSSRRLSSVLSSSARREVTTPTSSPTKTVRVSEPATGHPTPACPDPAAGPALRRPPTKRKLDLDVSDTQRGNRKPKRQKAGIAAQSPADAPKAVSPLRSGGSRHDLSLAILTEKFFQLMDQCADWVVDLNQAAETLKVRKRRLYDVTNVLKGIHLIKKTLKNKVQWIGHGAPGAGGMLSRCHALRDELAGLVQEEAKLDQLIQDSTLSISQMAKDADLQKHAYVTSQDIRLIGNLRNQTVLVVKAPYQTKLELPTTQESFQIHLTSTKGPINVFLCPDEMAPSGLPESVVHVNGNLLVPEESDQSSCRQTRGSPAAPPASSDEQFVTLLAPSTTQHLPTLDDDGIDDLFNFERNSLDSLL